MSKTKKKYRDKTGIYMDILKTLVHNPLPITQLRSAVNTTYLTLYNCLKGLEAAGYITITITRDEITGFRRTIKLYSPTSEGKEFVKIFDHKACCLPRNSRPSIIKRLKKSLFNDIINKRNIWGVNIYGLVTPV
jgi:predicted transcriptional regulator